MKTCNDMIHTAKTNTDLKVAVSDGIIAFNGIMFYVNPNIPGWAKKLEKEVYKSIIDRETIIDPIKSLIESLKSVAIMTKKHQPMWFYSNLDLSTLKLEYQDYGSSVRKVSIEISDVSGITRSEVFDECSFLFKFISRFINIDLASVKVITPKETCEVTE